ncbi:MAG: phosphoribosylformylglycinamidine synthase [Bacteroidales bacterium]|nr:phosphoribosylformylglycinamidine synthase [Bacteroidales bacterium]MDD3009804.1 phosphoribosylformylglycinamidine synthase [Bacteroidales bacterium]MDD3960314.1 phosphoribosylformylglycinamidine synthase [Bacteroidales bacterium]MDY0284737.1 phosphoribosylformylglycinamidine synthase [Bacteroidales bacterium]HPE87540.1 phosphoribosylformylglycinamidine synthase [Bacteroidales bacterium]
MKVIFFTSTDKIYAVGMSNFPEDQDIKKFQWLFSGALHLQKEKISGPFVGPRKEMITPWSTNAVEITLNMGIPGVLRIEEFIPDNHQVSFDPMLNARYPVLDQSIYTIEKKPEPILEINNIAQYNEKEGLALSEEEITYLNSVSREIGRKLTDSEVFGFSQVNSEHCRHKIFNGTFILDGEEKALSLFDMIRKTSKTNPNFLVSAYKDNVAFIQGPVVEQFAPEYQEKADFFRIKAYENVISLKAETHNFPTTVEPFNGAATGSGGEIRDRLGGGKGSLPIAGTAVYMTSYPRLSPRLWEENITPRQWLYQSPEAILIKASNGASDFGNKFGQPLICGSLLTFEHTENDKTYGYDKVIMLAGGVGYARKQDALKEKPEKNDKIVVLGGDNYRIGMGGGAVSSVETGEFNNAIELNAVQRSNPEMQKRVANAIRALAERPQNPIISIHDHGAGGHLNALSELVEETGGKIFIDKLPSGDPTLSAKEIIGNESQERMGLIIKEKDIELLKKIAARERAPMYLVGAATGDKQFTFENAVTGEKPIDLQLAHMFGNPPKTLLTDNTPHPVYAPVTCDPEQLINYLEQVVQLEAVACKDWLTNKVDRSVTGKIAHQQCAGELQLPLNDCGIVALDYTGKHGIATSIGHAPVAALADPEKGSRLAIAEALTNLVMAPLSHRLKGVSLSANWMWPAKNPGENKRLYAAVEAVSEFACQLGINIPTGKDSLSMTQKYPDGTKVFSPGTVIISAVGQTDNVSGVAGPVAQIAAGSALFYIPFSDGRMALGGSSFAQLLNSIGDDIPDAASPLEFAASFEAIQHLIHTQALLACHDVSAGGLITTLLEMNFASTNTGMQVDLSGFAENDTLKICFSEAPAIVIQAKDKKEVTHFLTKNNIKFIPIGKVVEGEELRIEHKEDLYTLDIAGLREIWFETSYLLDAKQTLKPYAEERFKNLGHQPLTYRFPDHFSGNITDDIILPNRPVKAAIIREKGVNGDREMAYALFLAGFEVKDIHMTDLISGREDLNDVNMIVYVGGFSNSDVLGSAKGWAGAFLYNEKAKNALDSYYRRPDTLSLGVCNGCQLMAELELIYPGMKNHPKLHLNKSGKFESGFINVTIPENNAVMLQNLAGSRLGVWVAHAEGRLILDNTLPQIHVAMQYSYDGYPANPNGSDHNIAALCSTDGRHLAMMPHIERSLLPWNWPWYPQHRNDKVTPWVHAFVNARKWIENSSNR